MTVDVIFVLLNTWGAVALMMTLLWLVQVKTKNAGFVDIGWTTGLLIAAGIYFFRIDGWQPRKLSIVLLVSIWAGRLLFLLLRRLVDDPSEDKRYQRIRADWKTHLNFKFFLMFQFQALVDVVLSWVILLICLNAKPTFAIVEILGIIISIVGLIGESLADEQLRAFKNNSSNKGKTCNTGLWYYSRHPNYFFEWLIWVGYFVFALSSPWGWTTIVAPALMFHFLWNISGIPLAEAQSLKSRGEEYRRYQQTTSPFIPWIKGGV